MFMVLFTAVLDSMTDTTAVVMKTLKPSPLPLMVMRPVCSPLPCKLHRKVMEFIEIGLEVLDSIHIPRTICDSLPSLQIEHRLPLLLVTCTADNRFQYKPTTCRPDYEPLPLLDG